MAAMNRNSIPDTINEQDMILARNLTYIYKDEADEEMKPEETAGKKKEGFFEKSEDNAGETAGGQSAETFKGQFQETSGKTNGETTALRGVNLSISKGEFVAVLGTNGSGKSTFARHINALHVPTEGVMLVEGMDTKEEANVWLIRQKAGMIFQNPDNQMVASIVEEDVAFGPENLGMEPEKIRMNVKEALEAVEMSAFRNATPSKLSGGQKQRIAIAGILAMRPECIILDEPTAMLDPRGRTEVVKTLQKLNQEEHMTVVYITHYMEEAVLADRVVVMDRGQVVMEGTPREIFFQVELMKQVGLDVPAMTELAWRLNRQGMNLDPAILTVEEMVNALCPSN